MSSPSKKILGQQKRLYGVLIGVSLAFVLLISLLFFQGDLRSEPSQPALELPSDHVDSNALWKSRMEAESEIVKEKVGYLESLVTSLTDSVDRKDQENSKLRSEVAQLRGILQEQQEIQSHEKHRDFDRSNEPFASGAHHVPASSPLQESLVREAPAEHVMVQSADIHSVEDSIPAGTTVKALLVSSVDASCAIGASANPQILKLQVLDDGRLPNRVMAKIKRGLVLASAYGDLSSERVFARIEKMTLINPDGTYLEAEVQGFVSGEDGKNGIRGVVVDRSEKLLTSAAASGFFAGVSDYLSATTNAQNLNSALRGLPNGIDYDILKSGAYSGAESALNQLAKYYVGRAEQLQPVIQVAAGRTVDITFTSSVPFGPFNPTTKGEG